MLVDQLGVALRRVMERWGLLYNVDALPRNFGTSLEVAVLCRHVVRPLHDQSAEAVALRDVRQEGQRCSLLIDSLRFEGAPISICQLSEQVLRLRQGLQSLTRKCKPLRVGGLALAGPLPLIEMARLGVLAAELKRMIQLGLKAFLTD